MAIHGTCLPQLAATSLFTSIELVGTTYAVYL